MIAGFIITTSALLACLGIYQLMKDRDAKPSNKVHPLSDDDMALWRQCLKIDEWKVIQNRYAREFQQERYEYFTLPKIYWAYRERQIDSENIRVLPYREGNGWVVQFGDVKGYGDTPEQAILNFDSAMGQRGGTSGNKP